jgi:arginyl-tRNA synthetase
MVYISDLMEEATEIMLENQEKSENTRIFGEDKLWNAEAVGISAWIINDRKFSWDKTLAHSGDTGVKFQYTHSRITSGVHCPRACISHRWV